MSITPDDCMTCNGAVRVLWDPYRGIIVDEVQDPRGEQ
jgi:hypothetical protein